MNYQNVTTTSHTAECVSPGHPDSACDVLGDRILDAYILEAKKQGFDPSDLRTAIEVLAKANKVTVAGEVRAPQEVINAIDIADIARQLWSELGYQSADDLVVNNYLEAQSPEIAAMIDEGGAGDQGIMCGYACTETASMLPREYELARNLLMLLEKTAKQGILPYLGSDAKSQVSLGSDGSVSSVIISAQHQSQIQLDQLRQDIFGIIVEPTFGDIDPDLVKINHKGSFVCGGPDADAGVLGRKIVVNAYGPRVPVGGGAYSGKDATKVDRSAAYQARQIAKTVLLDGFADAHECQVFLAYGIGQIQPEMVTAIIDGKHEVTDWVKSRFADLSTAAIIERLGLWQCDGWTYGDTGRYGHYGHAENPWEKPLL